MTTDGSCGATVDACRNYVLNQINSTRSSSGWSPIPSALSLNGTQSVGNGTCGSDEHSLWLYTNGYGTASFTGNPHQGFPSPDLCVSYFTAGENVGMCGGTGTTEANDLTCVHNMFMSEQHDQTYCQSLWNSGSTNHACNILNGSFTSAGVGLYWDAVNHAVYLTEDFIG